MAEPNFNVLPAFMRPGNRRRVNRSIPSPDDKATLVSILPKPINEVHHTIQPGIFNLPPGSYEKPALLTIGPSTWWVEGQEGMPDNEILESSIQVAASVVTSYSNGVLACNMTDMMPGLFFIKGEVNLVSLLKDHKAKLDAAKLWQDKWFKELVRITDILWARTNGNPICVSEDSRLAAKELGLKNKPWMGDIATMELIACILCGGLRNPKFPICGHCHHVIDTELYKKLGLQKVS